MGFTKYLFIDRDGTLIKEPKDYQVDCLSKLRFTKLVIPTLLELQKNGYKLIMVTNQDGLGSSSYPQKDFDGPHNMMMTILADQGVKFSDVLICPHLPSENCTCRKPHLGMVRKYLTDGTMDFQNSYVIGDRLSDISLAKNMGIEGLLFCDGELDKDLVNIEIDSAKIYDWKIIRNFLLNKDRVANLQRKTKETKIECKVNLDDNSFRTSKTGIEFFDHMLDQLSKHSGIGMDISCQGDIEVDDHHSVEDVGICLGKTLRQALGDKVGIDRYGFVLPMDEAQSIISLDLSGRSFLEFNWNIQRDKVGELSVEMVPHFFRSFCEGLKCSLHIDAKGENAHHIIEGIFKGVALSLKQAVKFNPNGSLPSTKGAL